jgi:hypothetical protein
MKKILIFTLGFILALTSLAADWKKVTADFFSKNHNYEQAGKYLETHLEAIPAIDKPTALLVLCFICKEIEDILNEERWLAAYFEKFATAEPDYSFLDIRTAAHIYEYLNRWKKKYPQLKSIAVNQSSAVIGYFSAPEKIKIDLDIGSAAELIISSQGTGVLYQGYLNTGMNTIELTLSGELLKNNENVWQIALHSGVIEIKKKVILSARFDIPANVIFNPQQGNLSIREKEFRPQEKKEMLIVSSRKLESKNIFKKVLLPGGLGLLTLLLNRRLIHHRLQQQLPETDSRSFLYALDSTSLVLSCGLTLKGVLNFLSAFKKQTSKTEKIILLAENIAYNRQLQEEIALAKENIMIRFTILATENNP